MLLRQATYFRALLDAAIVLGVDDRLLAVVGPRMGSRRSQRGALFAGQGEQPSAALALAAQRVGKVLAAAGDDLDLRGDQLTRDRLRQQRIALAGTGAQLLEARYQIQRGRLEDRELLLDADREVWSTARTCQLLCRGLYWSFWWGLRRLLV